MENIEFKKNTNSVSLQEFSCSSSYHLLLSVTLTLCLGGAIILQGASWKTRPTGLRMRHFLENSTLSGSYRHRQLLVSLQIIEENKTLKWVWKPCREVNTSLEQLSTEQWPHPVSKPVNARPQVRPDGLVSRAPQQNFPRTHCGKTRVHSVYIQTASKYSTAHETPMYNVT